jgi:hypothetical protein
MDQDLRGSISMRININTDYETCFFSIRGDSFKSVANRLDRFLWKLHFQSQRVGEAVGQVGESRQQMDVDDFRF